MGGSVPATDSGVVDFWQRDSSEPLAEWRAGLENAFVAVQMGFLGSFLAIVCTGLWNCSRRPPTTSSASSSSGGGHSAWLAIRPKEAMSFLVAICCAFRATLLADPFGWLGILHPALRSVLFALPPALLQSGLAFLLAVWLRLVEASGRLEKVSNRWSPGRYGRYVWAVAFLNTGAACLSIALDCAALGVGAGTDVATLPEGAALAGLAVVRAVHIACTLALLGVAAVAAFRLWRALRAAAALADASLGRGRERSVLGMGMGMGGQAAEHGLNLPPDHRTSPAPLLLWCATTSSSPLSSCLCRPEPKPDSTHTVYRRVAGGAGAGTERDGERRCERTAVEHFSLATGRVVLVHALAVPTSSSSSPSTPPSPGPAGDEATGVSSDSNADGHSPGQHKQQHDREEAEQEADVPGHAPPCPAPGPPAPTITFPGGSPRPARAAVSLALFRLYLTVAVALVALLAWGAAFAICMYVRWLDATLWLMYAGVEQGVELLAACAVLLAVWPDRRPQHAHRGSGEWAGKEGKEVSGKAFGDGDWLPVRERSRASGWPFRSSSRPGPTAVLKDVWEPTTAVEQHTKLASEMASPAWERLQSLAENVLSMQESSEDKEHHYSYYVNQQLGDDDLGEMDPVLAQQVLERLMRERMQELVDADANDMEDAQDNQSKDDDEDDDDEDSSPRSPRDIRPDETPDIDDPEVSELLDWTEQLPEE